MKKLQSLFIGIIAIIVILFFGVRQLEKASGMAGADTLTIYNWGDYIDPALIKKFERETGYKVNYETFDSNEAMYTKIQQGGTAYDIAIPSEYMIQKMMKAKMLLPLDHSKLKGLENIKVEKPTVEITEADIDKMIDVLRKQQATWVESKAAAEADSRVTIDFVGSVDGEEFEGGKATDFVLFMGQGRMIPGFEEGIVGHKAGEQFDINVTFPAEYHSENLKGKDAKFAITLKKVEEMELPELTDEFVAKFGPNTKTVADLRAEIRKNMERELKNALVSRVKQQVINGLIEQNPIDVPASAVEEEINVLRNQTAQRFGGNAQQAAQLPRELFEADAKRRVQVGLLFSEVIKSNELKADEERAKAMIADIASAYEQPAEVVEYYSKNEELMNNIRNVVLEEQAVDAVLAKAQVTEKASSFDEIMNPQA